MSNYISVAEPTYFVQSRLWLLIIQKIKPFIVLQNSLFWPSIHFSFDDAHKFYGQQNKMGIEKIFRQLKTL